MKGLYQNSSTILRSLGSIIAVLLSTFVHASDSTGTAKVMVLSIRAEIDPRMSRYVEYGIKEAETQEATHILIDMNTFGGALDDADKIKNLLLENKIPTWVFINKNAASAGALIAIACDKIYMEEGSNIGAATVVTGDGSPAPDKYQAYMRSMMRSTAEASGRNPQIAEGMVGRPLSQDSSKIGHVISYTTQEAIANGFCDGQVADLEEILAQNNVGHYSMTHYEHGVIDKLIAIFLNPYLRSLLLMVIIGGIYFELQTPGVGFPILAAALAAILYFVPSYLNGLSENWEIALFFVGIILVIVELFVIPGFGFIGISGIVCMFAALILVSLNNNVFDFTFVSSKDLEETLLLTGISSLVMMGLFFFTGKKLLESSYFKKISLQEQQLSSEGYTVATPTASTLVGEQAKAYTDLRPSGKVMIGDKLYDAFTSGEFIEKGEHVKVVALSMGALKVKKTP